MEDWSVLFLCYDIDTKGGSMQTTPAHELSTYSAVFEFCEMFPRAHSFSPHEKMRYLALRATINERAELNAVELNTAAPPAFLAALDLANAERAGHAASILRQRGVFMQEVTALAEKISAPVLHV